MYYLKLFLVICSLSQAQEHIIVYTPEGDTSKFHSFEMSFLEEVITLYNLNNSPEIKYTVEYTEFSNILHIMLNEDPSIIGIGTITRTNEREKVYDFSPTYYPIKSVIFTRTDKLSKSFVKAKIAYTKGSLEESTIQSFKKKYKIEGIPFSGFNQKLDAVTQGKVDFAITDNIQVFTNNTIKVVHTIKQLEKQGLSIIYPKASPLRKLNKYIEYFVHSKAYYLLLRDAFGKQASEYFKSNL